MVTASPSANETLIRLELRGGNEALWNARDREILVEGPRGTGKTRTILELINALCHTFDGLQVLIVRKYAVTLASTCLKTFNEQVLHSGDGVAFFHGSQDEPASYRYPNGSRITVGGLDNPQSQEKLKSGEYDLVYCNEVTELSEDDLVALKATLRHARPDGTPIIEHRRIICDCNPANRGHWVNQRCERGDMRRIRTTLKDNPRFAFADGSWTPDGEQYIANLPVSGPKRDSWVLGLWTGTENAIYPMFDRQVHIRPLEPGLGWRAMIIWVDYGSRHRCSVGQMGIDIYNRRWVFRCTGQPDTDQGKTLNLTISQYKERAKRMCSTVRGRVDPNQAYLGGQHGFSVAKGGNGGATGAPRLHRIDLLEPLFATYPGGRVPSIREEKGLVVPQGPFADPDTPGLLFVEGGEGIEELADQIEAYHYYERETPSGWVKDVYRDNEDHVAGMEYGNEEWAEGSSMQLQTRQAGSVRRPQQRRSWLGV